MFGEGQAVQGKVFLVVFDVLFLILCIDPKEPAKKPSGPNLRTRFMNLLMQVRTREECLSHSAMSVE
jgi:hypothetical protein